MSPPDRTLGHRAPLLWLALPLMAGLAAARLFALRDAAWPLAGALAAAGLAIRAGARGGRLWAPALVAAMVLAGAAQGALDRPAPPPRGALRLRRVRLSLRVERIYPRSALSKTVSGLATVVDAAGPGGPWLGRRGYFSATPGRGVPPPVRSAVVEAEGALAAVRAGALPDSFDGYLGGLGAGFRLTRARIVAEERPPSAYSRFCARLADRMAAVLGAGLERRPRLAAAYRAMMLGRRSGLPPGDRRLFLRAGAMHLFAINGVHIGVVALSLRAALELLRVPPPAAGVLVLAVLWLDVDATGASPSAVRAFLMVAALAAGGALRRPANAPAALAFSALAVLLFSPADLFGASFQMSYGVVAALCLLGLPMASRLRRRFPPYPHLPEALWAGPVPAGVRWGPGDRLRHLGRRLRGRAHLHLLGLAGPCLAAALAGAPAGVEFFRLLAPDGLLANAAFAPPASLAIAAGFASVAAGLAGAAPASRLFNCAAGLLIALVEAGMRLLTRLPWACVPAHFRAGWIGPAAQAAFLAACLAGYAARWRPERGGFRPPFAVIAIALVFGVKFGR